MEELLIVKYGEVVLKGNNRREFVNTLIRNIRQVLAGLGRYRVHKAQAMLYLEPEEGFDLDEAARRLGRVFGVHLFHRAKKVEKSLEAIRQDTVDYFSDDLNRSKTFKIEARRSDKQFAHRSQELNNILGRDVGQAFPHLRVDVHHPDITLYVNIRKEGVYIYRNQERGPGGLPVGTGGRATALLSGGIDSPLAAWLIARRGVAINALHFHSYPYTSERSRKKVEQLARILARYTGAFRLYVFPFTEIQEAIADYCPKEQLTILMRRMMMKSAEKLAAQNQSQALVTGESIGQVASQTMESLSVTDAAVNLPVFRPLIGMDKEEIIRYARHIGTYETSIQPHSDCCTLFVPKHPQTKPKLHHIEASEKRVDFDGLIDKALEKLEVEEVN